MYSSNDGHSEPTAVKGGDAEYKSVMDRYKKQKDAGTIGKMSGKRFMITFFLINDFLRSTAEQGVLKIFTMKRLLWVFLSLLVAYNLASFLRMVEPSNSPLAEQRSY